jgi:hypothetical protein
VNSIESRDLGDFLGVDLLCLQQGRYSTSWVSFSCRRFLSEMGEASW